LIPLTGFVILPLLFFLIKRAAGGYGSQQDGSVLRFDIALGMRALISLVIIALISFSVLVLVLAPKHGGGWYAVFVPLAVLLAILLCTPGTVLLDDGGIRQRRLLLSDKKIAWNEVAWMKRGWRTGTAYVKSNNGGGRFRFPAS
jgi:predicted small integral membrane protein